MATREPLPFMKSVAEAEALCDKEQDPFYLDAFMIEAWLGHTIVEVAAEYEQKKNAKDRTLQTGQSWRGFLGVFGHARDEEFHHVLQSLLRFAEYDDVQAGMLCRAFVPLSYEHERFSDFIGPRTLDVAKQPAKAVPLMRRSIERWCDWLDSLFHFQTHFRHHVLPESFDPDPEKSELASLGILQRSFPKLSDFSKKWWEWHHGEAAERIHDLSKWQMIGKLATAPLRDPPASIDEVVIKFWPLVKRYNWTYRDLMAVSRQVLPAPQRYPIEREQDLAAYCSNVLGLRKSAKPSGKSTRDGKPPGYEVALRL